MTRLACTRMDLLAAGMGVDPPGSTDDGNGDGDGGEANGGRGKVVALTPGSAEEWIARQGHGGMLLC